MHTCLPSFLPACLCLPASASVYHSPLHLFSSLTACQLSFLSACLLACVCLSAHLFLPMPARVLPQNLVSQSTFDGCASRFISDIGVDNLPTKSEIYYFISYYLS